MDTMEASGWQLIACCVLSGIVSGVMVLLMAWGSGFRRPKPAKDHEIKIDIWEPDPRKKYTQSR